MAMGTCAHCGREWYGEHANKKTEPRWIPTCPEGEIAAICVDCFDALPSTRVITLVQYRQKESYSGSVNGEHASVSRHEHIIAMTSTEHRLVDSAIDGWVKYMKGEAPEPPFEQEDLLL